MALLWPGLVLDTFQWDMLESLFDPSIREVLAKGNTGCGKGTAAGLAVCLWFFVWDDAKVVCTSATAEHVKSVLFGEVAKWFRAMKFPPAGKLLTSDIDDGDQHYVNCVNPDVGEAFSGRHGPHTLFVFDEATAIPDDRYKLADTQATKFLALANPRTLSGAFRRAFAACPDPNKTQTVQGRYGRRRCITIGGGDCLNVRMKRLEHPVGPIGGLEVGGMRWEFGQRIPDELYAHVKPIIPGQVCYDTHLSHCANTDARWVDVFAHGKFPGEDPETQVILPSWLPRHHTAWSQSVPVDSFGLDVAASVAGDETVLAAGSRAGCAMLHVCREADTMRMVGWVISAIKSQYGIDLSRGQHPIVVDTDGLGKPVADRLAEIGCMVFYHRGNGAAVDGKRYTNKRAEGYGELGRRLDPAGAWSGVPWVVPPDDMLDAELVAPEKIHHSDPFKFGITPKHRHAGSRFDGDTIVEKLGRSPDRADAVVYLFWATQIEAPGSGEIETQGISA